MDLLEFLEKRLTELGQERTEAEQSMDVIRDKIKNADAKRGNEPETEHYHKWSTILKDLERDLDKTRSIVVGRTAEIEQKQKKLAELREKAASQSQAGADISKRIMEMTDEEVANLTMEDIAILQEYELSLAAEEQAREPQSVTFEPVDTEEEAALPQERTEVSEETPPRAEPVAEKGQPIARKADPAAKEEETPPSDDAGGGRQQKGQMLAAAVKKLARDVGSVTLAELHVAIDGYAALRDDDDLDQEKERLRGALAVAVYKVRKEVTRIATKLRALEDLSTKDADEGDE